MSRVLIDTATRFSSPAIELSASRVSPRFLSKRAPNPAVFRAESSPSLYTTFKRSMATQAQQVTREETAEGLNSWKQRAPYRIHEPSENFPKRYEASCHCGQVQYQLSRDAPLDSKLCHCTTCQTQHAAPFQWAAIFHKTDIHFVKGHHGLEWYDPSTKSADHRLPCKVRCNYCHSPIMDEGRNMILLFPSLVHFKTEKDRVNFKPRCHMFYGERVMDIPDGLPKWTGLNETSELIADSPPDQIRDIERKRAAEQQQAVQNGVQQAEG